MHLRPRIVAPALLLCLLAGCGSSADSVPSASAASADPTTSAAPATTEAPTSTPEPGATPAPAPAKAAPKAGAGPVELLPWPTTSPTRLQAGVDAGAQPWLLDPSDLADSYVSAAYGWTAADSIARPGGTSASTKVDVSNTDGARRTLTVTQPEKKGSGGIWLVTADTKA